MSTYTFTCARVPVYCVPKHHRIKTSIITHSMDEKCSYSQKTQRIPLGFHLLKKINFDRHALMFVFYPGLPHMYAYKHILLYYYYVRMYAFTICMDISKYAYTEHIFDTQRTCIVHNTTYVHT